jgi:uncharacterized membrane protein
MHRLRRSFIAGFFVTVPLVVSVAAFVGLIGFVDDVTSPLYERLLGRRIPGLGILTTAGVILAVGGLATNVIGKRILERTEGYLLRVPVFKTIYAPVKQLADAFSPDNELGFKRVVLVPNGSGYSLGFLTKEFSIDRDAAAEQVLAVYVPTNHLYLGDIVICPHDRAIFPQLSVEDGIRIFLTGGMALPSRLVARRPRNGAK